MIRLHRHLAANDLAQSLQFYSTLFGTEPTVIQHDYAKWDLDDPAVNFAISSRCSKPGLDHVDLQTDSKAALSTIQQRLEAANIAGKRQSDNICCSTKSDKYWTFDPQGIAWETFHTLSSIPTFNELEEMPAEQSCCVP